MSAGWAPAVWIALAGAAILFALDVALSVALLAAASLSRVALHRLSVEGAPSLSFLDEIRTPLSAHRMAAQITRQACLLGASLLVGLAARRAGSEHAWLLAALAGLLAVLLLETWLARAVSQRDARAALRTTAPLLRLLRRVERPLLAPLEMALRWTRPPAAEADESEEEQEEEALAFFEVGEKEGILEADEGKMMRGIMYLGETRVREIMTPRTDIVALPADTRVAAAREALIAAAHSRLPVYRGSIDDIVGVLHVRDLVRAWEQAREGAPIAGYLRPAFFVPETLSVAELLAEMKVRTHLAIVVDEYGGVAGLVTLEDVLEEIVGDIRDEHDREEADVLQDSDGSWLVSGLAHVDELERLFGLEFEERDFDTVGGLVISSAGRVPEQGEVIDVQRLSIEVVHADPRRVYRVRIRPLDGPDRAQATA